MALFAKRPQVVKEALSDGVITLVASELSQQDAELGIRRTFLFRIMPCGTKKDAGRISLRCGESSGLYYFGHIGYHVGEKFRGHGYALRACRLLIPLCRVLHIHSLVITTDTDNIASRRTCEKLGCELESIVSVPLIYRQQYQMGAYKCRYIFRIPRE
jgi:predicted acetyltransferase